MTAKKYDFIIIGAGAAGCVLANKLSENPKNSVCLLEAGPKDNSPFIHHPIGVVQLMHSKKYNWQYYSAPEPTLNNRRIFNPRGKTLGGSTSINAMLYTRGQKEDYDHWAELGNQGWAYDDLLPFFKATQNQERGESDFHGIGGGLNVCETRSNHPLGADFIQAAVNAGFGINNDFNGKSQEGVGYYQVMQKEGKRHSAAKGFLDPIKDRKNLTIVTDACVKILKIKDKKVTGVEYLQEGKTLSASAKKEVILSAGAFGSPQILMLSGIGNKAELAEHSIICKHELNGVGKNLQDHPDVLVVNEHNKANLLSLSPKSWPWLFKDSTKFLKDKTGVVTTSVVETGGFIKSSSAMQTPDLQLHFIPGAMDDHGRNLPFLAKSGISLHVCILRPKSRGQVTLHSKLPHCHPKIELNMLAHEDDMKDMIQGVKLARQILAQRPLAQDNGHELFPGEDVQTDEQIAEFLRQKTNTIYHPVGTCKMGNDELAVVDSELKVHGLQGVRVVDASIMPTLISGNTTAPTVAIAAKAAELILQQH